MKKKLKTNKGALKRFSITKNGKILGFRNRMKKAGKRAQLLSKYKTKVSKSFIKTAKRLLGK